MPQTDEFGGVAVDEPKTDEFGGIAVDEYTPEESAKLGLQAGLAATDVVRRVITSPAAAEASAMGQAQGAEERKQQMQRAVTAGGGPMAGLSFVPPGPIPTLVGQALEAPANLAVGAVNLADVIGRKLTPPSLRTQPAFGQTPEEFARKRAFQPGVPLYQPQSLDPSDAQKILEAASTPESLLTLPIGLSKTGGKVLLFSMIPGLVKQVSDILKGGGGEQEQRDRINALVVPALIGLSATRPGGGLPLTERLRVRPPDFTEGMAVPGPITLTGGELPGLPRGAPAIRPPTAFDVTTPPAPGKQAILPKPPLPNVPRSAFQPEVPATPPEPQRQVSVLQEIRQANARTRADIQKLFADRDLTNEEAAALRDLAFPEDKSERQIARAQEMRAKLIQQGKLKPTELEVARGIVPRGTIPPETPPEAPGAAPAPPTAPTPPPAPATPAPAPAVAAPATGATGPVADFENLLNQTERRVTNTDTDAAGLQMRSVQDLDALKAMWQDIANQRETLKERQKTAPMDEKIALLNQGMALVTKGQLIRETIEVATNSGGPHEEGAGTIPKKLGPRPLDYRQHPEVSKWLEDNAKDIGIKHAPEQRAEPIPEAPSEVSGKSEIGVSEPSGQVAPAPAASESEWLGKPLSYWDKLAQDLPKGDERARLAKSLGVANQPAKIAQHIKRRVAEIRAAPPRPASPAETVEPAGGTKPVETATATPKSETKAPKSETATHQPETVKPQAAGKALRSLVGKDRDAVHAILANAPGDWQLSPDGERVVSFDDSRARGPGTGGGRSATTEFINWLLSDEATANIDPKETEYLKTVEKARRIVRGEPEPSEATPAPETLPAIEKAQAEVSKAVSEPGKRSPEDIKSELVSQLEKAVADAPFNTDDYFAGLHVSNGKVSKVAAAGSVPLARWLEKNPDSALAPKFISYAMGIKKVPKITIDIPGDGHFEVWNTKDALQTVLDRAKRISTAPGAPVKVSRAGTSKADKEWVAEQIAKQPPAPVSVGPGAASPAEFAERPPDPEVVGFKIGSPALNRLQRGFSNLYAGIEQLVTRRAQKQDLMRLANAAVNMPEIAGLRASESIRYRSTEQQRRAATHLMQSLKMSGEGLGAEAEERLGQLDFAGDPTGWLQFKEKELTAQAQVFLNKGEKIEAQAAVDAARDMRYAREHYNELKPLADLAKEKFDLQYKRDAAAGLRLDYENWYVPQRHELDLFTAGDRPIVLGQSRGGGGGRAFQKSKYYETYADAIENGFIPRTTDIADLLQHRVAASERVIARKALFDGLKKLTDPVDGKPLAIKVPRRVITKPDGTVDVQESLPLGYEMFEPTPGARIGVHAGYGRLMRALTGSSQIAESAVVGTLQDLAAVEKHMALALDTFHASRTLQAEFALTGKMSLGGARQRLGRALVEYSPHDLDAAVKAGEITQEMADYIRTPQPMEIHGKTVKVSPANSLAFGIRNGLNVARIGDALYRDWLRNMPITGAVNKWVFDKMTRSAITHSYLLEFERVAKAHPEWDAARAARTVASDINVLFGNLQKESFFRNPSFRSISQILFLAPQWVESLARREARAAGQLARIALDVARGRPVQLGTAGRAVGTGLAAYFLGTQILNLLTRHQFTFQNPEQGHKLDAWIPGLENGSRGFFISPLSVFGEITHDILRYAQTKPDLATALSQIGANKLGNLGRFLGVVATGRDPLTGEKIIGTGRRAMQAAIQLVPVPITLSQAGRAGLAAVAPGVVSPPPPGAVQRQLTASVGLKTEPAPSASTQILQKVNDWKEASPNAKYRHDVERRQKEDFGQSDYADLRRALGRGDMKGARAAYQELRADGKTPKTIRQTIQHPHPFTGSAAAESRFRASLNEHDRDLYRQALDERRQLYHQFEQMLNTPP